MPPYEYWNREELYQEVWSMAMSTLAKRHGISDVGLAKVCRRLNIPVPGRGYWARKQARHAVVQTPLPKLTDLPRIEKPPPGKEPLPLAHTADEEERALVERLASLRGTDVLKRGSLSHPLISQARDVLKGARTDDRKILRTRDRCLDIRVSKDRLDRALRAIAGFIELAEAEEFSVVVGEGRPENTSLVAFDQHVKFSLLERVQRVDLDHAAAAPVRKRVLIYGGKAVEYRPTGELFVEAFSFGDGLRKKWKEGKAGRMEELIPSVLAGLLRIALAQRSERQRQAVLENERRRKAEERAILRAAVHAEEAKVRDLRRLAAEWTRAEQLRTFISAARDSGQEQGCSTEQGTPFGDWLAWAERQADRLDPLRATPESIIDRKSDCEVERPIWYGYKKPAPPFRFKRPVWQIGLAAEQESLASDEPED